MAIMKYSTKRDVVSVFEDLSPGKNTIYIEGEGFNKTTLAYKHNSHMFMADGGRTNYIGVNRFLPNNNTTWAAATGVTGVKSGSTGGSTMVLAKDVAYCNQANFGPIVDKVNKAISRSVHTNICPLHLISMDPLFQRGALSRVVSNDNTTAVMFWYVDVYPAASGCEMYMWDSYASSPELYIVGPKSNSVTANAIAVTSLTFSLAVPTTEYANSRIVSELVCSSSTTKTANCAGWGLRTVNMQTGVRGGDAVTTKYFDAHVAQFLGQLADGSAVYLFNSNMNDFTQKIVAHKAVDNTVTIVSTFGSAGGVPGERATTTLGRFNKYSSKIWQSPVNSNIYYWFTPYFDTSLNYVPFVFTWNKSTDAFSRTPCVMTGQTTAPGGSWPAYNGTIPGLVTVNVSASNVTTAATQAEIDLAQFAAIQWNETFVGPGGNRYLTMITLSGQARLYGGSGQSTTNSGGRVMFTYEVNAADPTQLFFHSSISLTGTARNAVFLNDQKTLLGIITDDKVLICSWDDAAGWQITSSIPGIFTSIGRDSTDRIWATEAVADGDYVNIHTLTVGVPIRVTMQMAQSNYDYDNANIATTVSVSAYNFSNQRVAVSVNLAIVGNTLSFGGSSSTTITTLTGSDVVVPIDVTGAGISDIVASINL